MKADASNTLKTEDIREHLGKLPDGGKIVVEICNALLDLERRGAGQVPTWDLLKKVDRARTTAGREKALLVFQAHIEGVLIALIRLDYDRRYE